jgi:hypothetical protein
MTALMVTMGKRDPNIFALTVTSEESGDCIAEDKS